VILLKPGKLLPEEFEEIKQQTTICAKTLEEYIKIVPIIISLEWGLK